jgi:hypothetical protein
LDISTLEPEGTTDDRSQDDLRRRLDMSGTARGTAGYGGEYRTVISRSDNQFYYYRQVKFIRHFG